MNDTIKRIKNVIKYTDLLLVVPKPRKLKVTITYKDGTLFLRSSYDFQCETDLWAAMQNTSPFEWIKKLNTDFKNSLEIVNS